MAAARSRIAAARSVGNRPAARFTVAVGSYGPAASARAQKGPGSAASDASCASTNVNGSARSRAARAVGGSGQVAGLAPRDGLAETVWRQVVKPDGRLELGQRSPGIAPVECAVS